MGGLVDGTTEPTSTLSAASVLRRLVLRLVGVFHLLMNNAEKHKQASSQGEVGSPCFSECLKTFKMEQRETETDAHGATCQLCPTTL